MIVIYTIAFGLSIGATAVVSRRIGEKDADGAARAAVQVLALGTLISAILGIFGAIYALELLQLMGADAEVLAEGTGYARVLILGNGINIVLDPALIFGLGPFPELGLTGAAIASSA